MIQMRNQRHEDIWDLNVEWNGTNEEILVGGRRTSKHAFNNWWVVQKVNFKSVLRNAEPIQPNVAILQLPELVLRQLPIFPHKLAGRIARGLRCAGKKLPQGALKNGQLDQLGVRMTGAQPLVRHENAKMPGITLYQQSCPADLLQEECMLKLWRWNNLQVERAPFYCIHFAKSCIPCHVIGHAMY